MNGQSEMVVNITWIREALKRKWTGGIFIICRQDKSRFLNSLKISCIPAQRFLCHLRSTF